MDTKKIRNTTYSHQINLDRVDRIILIISNHFGIDFDKYLHRIHKREIVQARQIAMYLAKKLTDKLSKTKGEEVSLKEIGRKFLRDHSTVIHSIKTINNLIYTEKKFRGEIKRLEEEIFPILENMGATTNENFIDMNNSTSFKIDNEKAIILTGFSEREIELFAMKNNITVLPKIHRATGMFLAQ